MCRVPVQLRELVKQRLDEAADEIFALVEKILGEYEEKTERQREKDRALLEQLLQPRVSLSPDNDGAEAVGSAGLSCEPHFVKEEEDSTRNFPRQTHTGIRVVAASAERSSVTVKTEREETPLPYSQTLPTPLHTQTQTLPTPPHTQTQTLPTPPHTHTQTLPTPLPPLHTQTQTLHTPPHTQNQSLQPPPHTQTIPPHTQTLPTPPHTQTQSLPPPEGALLQSQAAVESVSQDVWTGKSLLPNPLLRNPEPPQPWACPGPSVFTAGDVVLQNSVKSGTRTQKPQKRFHCTLCPKAFSSNFHLVSHMRIHTGERPFECPVCEKGFRVKGNLDQHMMIHYDLRPFSCNFCGKSFSQKSNLNNHIWVHTGIKPFSCSVCGKRYRQRSSLSLHMASH